MCVSCDLQDNYFHTVDCVYQHLLTANPILWLRDSPRVRSGHISRSFLSTEGKVLAIWNGAGKGWRLRTYAEEALDEIPQGLLPDYIFLETSAESFQAFMFIDDGHREK